jgi:hypothetical protein
VPALSPTTPADVTQLEPVPISIGYTGLPTADIPKYRILYTARDAQGRQCHDWALLCRPASMFNGECQQHSLWQPPRAVLPVWTPGGADFGTITLSEGVWGYADGWYQMGFRFAHQSDADAVWTGWHRIGIALRITSGVTYVDTLATASGEAGTNFLVSGAKAGTAIDADEVQQEPLTRLDWAFFDAMREEMLTAAGTVDSGARTFTSCAIPFPAKPGVYDLMAIDQKRKGYQRIRATSTAAPTGVITAIPPLRDKRPREEDLVFEGYWGGGGSDATPGFEYQNTSGSLTWVDATSLLTTSEIVTGANRGGKFAITFPGSVSAPWSLAGTGNNKTFKVRRTDTNAECSFLVSFPT